LCVLHSSFDVVAFQSTAIQMKEMHHNCCPFLWLWCLSTFLDSFWQAHMVADKIQLRLTIQLVKHMKSVVTMVRFHPWFEPRMGVVSRVLDQELMCALMEKIQDRMRNTKWNGNDEFPRRVLLRWRVVLLHFCSTKAVTSYPGLVKLIVTNICGCVLSIIKSCEPVYTITQSSCHIALPCFDHQQNGYKRLVWSC